MLHSLGPVQPDVPKTEKPRQQGRLTGERLPINKVQLVESLLRAGASITQTAKDIGISRNSVKGIADRLKSQAVNGVAALSGVQPEQTFDGYVNGDLQRVARLALTSITEDKAKKSTLRDLAFTTDKMLGRLEVIEARTTNLHVFAQIFAEYGITPSHSASRMTLEQKITVETQHTPEAEK
jgi:hypothetical protein